jgi:alcohol dehydrogenase class IV
MKAFTYQHPTEIQFGCGCIREVGHIAARWGTSCLLVTVPEFEAVAPVYRRVKDLLAQAGLHVTHFDGVIPNPTTEVVSAGAALARESGADMVIGLGGGSSMDTAKAIAVEATHEGTAWDYLHYKTPPSEKTLPILAIPTTSGTGSQTTPCAVITRSADKDKSAIWHPNIFPRVALIDPELVVTLPGRMTAMTGFDAFAHNFEAFLSVGSNPYVDMLALEGIRLILENLPKVLADGTDLEARSAMAWADTLGGMAISSGGVTLPHGLGMQISGHCPHVAHGESLAVTYPAFTRYTWQHAVDKFAVVGRLFNPELSGLPDEAAAEACCMEIDGFLQRIGLWIGFEELGVSESELRDIAADGQVLGDYRNNPRVATLEEMLEMLLGCVRRGKP